jgi:hypothetical protein
MLAQKCAKNAVTVWRQGRIEQRGLTLGLQLKIVIRQKNTKYLQALYFNFGFGFGQSTALGLTSHLRARGLHAA